MLRVPQHDTQFIYIIAVVSSVKFFTVNFPLFTEILFVLPKNHITCPAIEIRFVLTTAG